MARSRRPYSHPQALGQSPPLSARKRGIVPLSHADTAGAAVLRAETRRSDLAAIAPAIAAELYGLRIIEENVEDTPDNMTRFVILASEPLPCGHTDRQGR